MRARVLVGFGIIGLVVTTVLHLAGTNAHSQKEPYKIGAVFSITGVGSFLGDPEKKTVEMIVEQINGQGGIDGHPLEVILLDDESDATKCNLVVKRLIKKDEVPVIIGPSRSGESLAVAGIAEEAAIEKVIVKLRAGSMPPPGNARPDPATYASVATALENLADQAWTAHPNPGRIGAVQRLNRTEYNNAIRDLFAIDLDVKPLLPGDDTADGSFDNFADSLTISTAHLERYMSVARQVTRLATGLPPAKPAAEHFEIPLHVMQEDRMSEDLPFGSRGGMAIHYDFPVDGEYLIHVRLQRQYQDYLKGMGWPQQLEVRLDGKLLKRFMRRWPGQGPCRGVQLRR